MAAAIEALIVDSLFDIDTDPCILISIAGDPDSQQAPLSDDVAIGLPASSNGKKFSIFRSETALELESNVIYK